MGDIVRGRDGKIKTKVKIGLNVGAVGKVGCVLVWAAWSGE